MTARSAKAEALRDRICESAIALYSERSFDGFTLDDVARKADTTVQTILRAFKSKDNLVYESLERLTSKESPHYADRPGGFRETPPGDVAAAVAEIHAAYEIIGDLVIRNLSNESRNKALTPLLERGREHHREWLRAVFAPQLERLRAPERAQLFNCLIVATDVYTWKILRRDMGLSRAGAEAVVRDMIAALTSRESFDVAHSVAQLVGRRQPAA